METIKILSEPSIDKPFCVIYKPSGLPSAPLNESDKNNAFSQAADIYHELLNVKGKKEVEHGLLHRIDNETEGVLLIASSQDFYDYMMNQQNLGKFIKYYCAICEKKDIQNMLSGFPELAETNINNLLTKKTVIVESYFRNFGKGKKEVRPVLINEKGAVINKVGKLKKYITEIQLIKIDNNQYIFQCKINSGYRHQVRCHLAWLGFPIIGDKIYNRNSEGKMLFKATELEFEYNGIQYRLGFDQ